MAVSPDDINRALAILAYADPEAVTVALDRLEGLDLDQPRWLNPNVRLRVRTAIELINADDQDTPFWATRFKAAIGRLRADDEDTPFWTAVAGDPLRETR